MTPDERFEVLSREVYEAARNQAPHEWMMDYVEYVGEYLGEPVPTFADYLRFQVQQEEETEMEERQAAGQYLSDLLRYLNRCHPELYCNYCGTFDHDSSNCPETPVFTVTITLDVPASVSMRYQSSEEFIRNETTFPDGVQVRSVIEEEEE